MEAIRISKISPPPIYIIHSQPIYIAHNSRYTQTLLVSLNLTNRFPLSEMGRKFFVGGNWKCVSLSLSLTHPVFMLLNSNQSVCFCIEFVFCFCLNVAFDLNHLWFASHWSQLVNDRMRNFKFDWRRFLTIWSGLRIWRIGCSLIDLINCRMGRLRRWRRLWKL